MPKSRHIVDSCTLLFTTSRSTEAPKHNAQIETNRRFLQSPFYDVQVDRGSQTRCPNRDQSSILAASFLRRPGRQRLRNTTQILSTPHSDISIWPPRGGQLRADPKSNALLWPPRGGQPRNLSGKLKSAGKRKVGTMNTGSTSLQSAVNVHAKKHLYRTEKQCHQKSNGTCTEHIYRWEQTR